MRREGWTREQKARAVRQQRRGFASPPDGERKEAIPRREPGEVLADIARTYNANHSIISRL
jgi:hypothetical protein